MNSLNATVRLGSDAELRYTPANDAVCQFNAALTSGYGKNAKTSWLRCTVWGKKSETLSPMLRKGNQIAITGEITLAEYQDKQGQTKYSLDCRVSDVTLLGSKDSSQNSNVHEARSSASNEQKAGDFDDLPNDLPF